MFEITPEIKRIFDEAEKKFFEVRRQFQDERDARNLAVSDVVELIYSLADGGEVKIQAA